jgi:hypothetical protein
MRKAGTTLKSARTGMCLAVLFSLTAFGCTTEQAYNTGQAWQRKQCNKIADQSERDRCMSETGASYEDYKRDTGGDRK